jgi:hypothetical protein
VAALGRTYRVGMVDLWFVAGLAQREFSPAGTTLYAQALDWRCVPDLRIHAGSAIFISRPSRSGMVVQSPAVFDTRNILCRYCSSDYFSAQFTNQFDRHRTPGRLDFSRGTFFCQLGLCHIICRVRFASDVKIEIVLFIKAIVWKILFYE